MSQIIKLRDYQEELTYDTRSTLKKVRRVLAQLATGGGKTIFATNIVQKIADSGRQVLFICHRNFLISQTSETFRKYGIDHSFIAPTKHFNKNSPVIIASIDKLGSNLDFYLNQLNIHTVIFDECHHMAARSWADVSKAFNNSYHVGLSATPKRLDGAPLDVYFDSMVFGPQPAELMDMGHLSDYKLYYPNKGSDIEEIKGSFVIGDSVQMWEKYASGMRTAVFCRDVKHAETECKKFNEAGFKSVVISHKTKKPDMINYARQMANGELDCFFNAYLMSEGFDLAAMTGIDTTIDCVQLLRNSGSLAMVLQMIGRCLRPKADGSKAVIIDQCGNTFNHNHGKPDDYREWDLSGEVKTVNRRSDEDPNIVSVVKCENIKCQKDFVIATHCPHCGHERKIQSSIINNIKGDLVEVKSDRQISNEIMDEVTSLKGSNEEVYLSLVSISKKRQTIDKKTKRKKYGDSWVEKMFEIHFNGPKAGQETDEELIWKGKLRGYKNPVSWVKHKQKSRGKKWA